MAYPVNQYRPGSVNYWPGSGVKVKPPPLDAVRRGISKTVSPVWAEQRAWGRIQQRYANRLAAIRNAEAEAETGPWGMLIAAGSLAWDLSHPDDPSWGIVPGEDSMQGTPPLKPGELPQGGQLLWGPCMDSPMTGPPMPHYGEGRCNGGAAGGNWVEGGYNHPNYMATAIQQAISEGTPVGWDYWWDYQGVGHQWADWMVGYCAVLYPHGFPVTSVPGVEVLVPGEDTLVPVVSAPGDSPAAMPKPQFYPDHNSWLGGNDFPSPEPYTPPSTGTSGGGGAGGGTGVPPVPPYSAVFSPGSPVQKGPPHRFKRNKNEKDKMRGNSRTLSAIYKVVTRWINDATESGDFINAVWMSLTKKQRHQAFKDNGYKPLDIFHKAAFIITNPGQVDWVRAFYNVAMNEIQDHAFGLQAQASRQARKKAGYWAPITFKLPH